MNQGLWTLLGGLLLNHIGAKTHLTTLRIHCVGNNGYYFILLAKFAERVKGNHDFSLSAGNNRIPRPTFGHGTPAGYGYVGDNESLRPRVGKLIGGFYFIALLNIAEIMGGFFPRNDRTTGFGNGRLGKSRSSYRNAN